MGIVFQSVDEAGDLIDGHPAFRFPAAPLLAINGPEFAVLVGPFIPDSDPVFLEIRDIGFAFQEPEEFVDDGAEMELLGGQDRETLAEVVADLMSKDRASAGARPIRAFLAMGENVSKQVEVLLHKGRLKRED